METLSPSAPEAAGRPERPLSTFAAARALGVAFSTVNYWVDRGILPGFRTPGGHRRIHRADLETFIRRRNFARPGPVAKVLLVDDDARFRRALARVVAKKGGVAVILEADNGFDAGRLIVEERPAVVILDIQMPGIDGFEVLRRIAAMAHRPAVIVVSGHSPRESRKKAIDLGAVEFFSKPLDTEAFLSALAKLLGQGTEVIARDR